MFGLDRILSSPNVETKKGCFTVKIPGSKSILLRLMLLMAYAKRDMTIQNYNPCSDVRELEAALQSYGYRISGQDQTRIFKFDSQLCAQSQHHYAFQQSATAFRLWLSFLAALPGISSQLSLSDILLFRGYAPLQQALEAMGAKIILQGNIMQIQGCQLSGGQHILPGNISSQYASSLILATPNMQHELLLKLSPFQVSQSYINLSLQMLRLFGGKAQLSGTQVQVHNQALRLPTRFTVDADFSTVAYYAARAALQPPAVKIPLYLNPSLNQADEQILDFLKQMGARVRKTKKYVQIKAAPLKGANFDLKDSPDLMPLMAILALFGQNPSTLKSIGRLIYKESNRIDGVCKALQKLEAKYFLAQDSIKVYPLTHEPGKLKLDTQEDHRLVMAFSLLTQRYPQIQLSEYKSLCKSFPFGYQELIAAPA